MREFRRKRVRLGLEGRVRVRVRVENELKGSVRVRVRVGRLTLQKRETS